MSVTRLSVLLVLGTAGCTQRTPPGIPPAVSRLMECIECQGAELDSVVAVGQPLVPVLRMLLTDGPPISQVEALRQTLELQLSGTAVAPPPLPPEQRDSVIVKQLDDYRNVYRTRAAFALGAIGGQQARDALCQLDPGSLTQPVRDAVDSALARSGGPC